LDGDDLRRGLCSDLSYDRDGRAENARRASETAALIAEAGVICVVALISPYATDRASARSVIAKRGVAFLEVFVDAPLGVCEARDPKGLYRLARTGVLPHFTGISSPYQAPQTPDIHVKTSELDLEECVSTILSALIEVDEQGDAVVLGRFLRVEK
jgi:adenylyl-sulfate kinase